MTNPDDKTSALPAAECLLVVEDEILVRLAIAAYLRECGFTVVEAASADEAVTVLQEADITIHLVLSDVEMPGSMDGFGLSQWIRTNKPGLPVMLCGSPSRAADVAADLCEKGPMLAKPYEPHLLLDQIRRTLAEAKRALDAALNRKDGE